MEPELQIVLADVEQGPCVFILKFQNRDLCLHILIIKCV